MNMKLTFDNRSALADALGHVQDDPRVTSCSVDLRDLSLSVRTLQGPGPAPWLRRAREVEASRPVGPPG